LNIRATLIICFDVGVNEGKTYLVNYLLIYSMKSFLRS